MSNRWKLTTVLVAGLATVMLVTTAGARPPAPPPSITEAQANAPQIQGDPSGSAHAVFPTNKQNEPTIAVNPTNASFLIAGSNDEQRQPPCGPGPVRGPDAAPSDCSFFPGVGTSGVYTSSDGGATWTNRGLLDDQPTWIASALVSDGDPVIVYGPRPVPGGGFSYAGGARAYYATLASFKDGRSPYPSFKSPEVLAVSYSDDNGLTWSAPVIATKDNPNDFNDKESIWADNLTSSPYFGRVYISWTEFRSAGGPPEPIDVAVSTDGGRSFGLPTQLSPASNTGAAGGRQGSALRSGPDGSAYVAWSDSGKIVVSVSRNGGGSWTRPITVGRAPGILDPIPGANFRTDDFPSIAADPTPGSKVLYVAWAADSGTGGRIVISTSTDRGMTWSRPVTVSTVAEGYAFSQGLNVAPNGRVDLAYQALTATDPSTFGTGNAAINSWYASLSNGAWSSPAKVTTRSSDPAASAQNNLARQFFGDYNTLVSTNSWAWFIYTDTRDGVGCPPVDEYQHVVFGTDAAREDEEDRVATRLGQDPYSHEPGEKPAPPEHCTTQFGNSNVFVSMVQQ